MYIDFVFLKIFHVLVHLKKHENGAKWSAFLFTGLYMTAIVVALLCILGLLYDNKISDLLKQNPIVIVMIIGVITPLLLSIRYYWKKNIISIEEAYDKMGKIKRNFVDIFVYSSLIGIPIFAFILFRLFVAEG